MTLTIGTGPFGEESGGTFNFDTGLLQRHTLYFEDSPRRVRVMFGGETLADTKRAKLLRREGQIIPEGSQARPGTLIGIGPGLCGLPRT